MFSTDQIIKTKLESLRRNLRIFERRWDYTIHKRRYEIFFQFDKTEILGHYKNFFNLERY